MIIRSTWKQNYTVVPNAVFDRGLTAEATGTLCYLIGRSEGWKVSAVGLAKHFGCGRERMNRVMAELERNGYAFRRIGGKSGGFDWIVSDNPIVAKPDSRKTRLSGFGALPSKDLLPSTEEEPSTKAQAPSPAAGNTGKKAPRKTRTAFVAPTLEEVHAYAKAKEAPWCATEFWNHFEANGWLVSGRSKMANWHRAFDNWVIRDKRFEADREQRARGFR